MTSPLLADAPPSARLRPSPLDDWTLGYVVVVSAAVALRWPSETPLPWAIPLAHLLLLWVALLAPRARAKGAAGRFLGAFYGLVLCAALYTEIGLLNGVVGRAYDPLVQQWEQALFSFQPSLAWIRAVPSPRLSWVLHLGYLSYYLILAGAPLGLWLTRRRAAAAQTAYLTMVAFYVCYSVFLFFPVAGPRYLFPLADNAATAVPPAVFTQRLLDGGAAWGTAFPSSHVAASLVASLAAARAWPLFGSVFVLLAILLALGTVYGQFHYAVDALAGALVAAAVLAFRRRLLGRGTIVW